jgi:uncharacterized protein YjiS (DUF1127 family)
MKLFQFAVASIVDANTGYGYVHNLDKIDYDAEIKNSRLIRSQSFVDLLGSIVRRVSASFDRYKDRIQQRRTLSQLYRLNGHLLRDIGLTTSDLNSVAAERISFEQLNSNRRGKSVDNARQTTVQTTTVNQTLAASNQDDFNQTKCA